jgi:3-hydroxyisobutyrate dehydrogenase-like beta-hydroxyacid dehydrogenase
MDLALQLGRELGVPLPSTAATQEVLTATRAFGYGEEDFAVIFHGLARMSGVARG